MEKEIENKLNMKKEIENILSRKLYLNEVCVGAPGKTIHIKGDAKTGKTELCTAIIASSMVDKGHEGFRLFNPAGMAVIYVDVSHTNWLRDVPMPYTGKTFKNIDLDSAPVGVVSIPEMIRKKANIKTAPKWFVYETLADHCVEAFLKELEKLLIKARIDFGGICAVVLDQFEDIIPSYFTEKMILETVDALTEKSKEFGFVFICVQTELSEKGE